MSWFCNLCETENPDTVDECEVCGAVSPHLKEFHYDVDANKQCTLHWHVEGSNKVSLNYQGHTIDVTLTDLYELPTADVKEVSFNLFGEAADRSFKYKIEPATIYLESDKDKLRECKETSVVLKWEIDGAMKAKLFIDEKVEEIPLIGSLKVACLRTSKYVIKAINSDGISTTSKELVVSVYKECEIVFSADKENILPRIPVLLSWNVKNASSIKLNGESIDAEGSKIVKPEVETFYTLVATDAFGETEKQLKISMLPLPVIKTIMVPTPQIAQKISITNSVPRLHVDVSLKLPNISPPQIKSINPSFTVENPKVKYPNKLQTLSIDIGEGFWKRLKTAVNIVSNKVEKLKFNEDGRDKRNK